MANSLFDELLQGMGSAINDIREKVVEEAYFGRVVSDGPQAPEQPAAAPEQPAAPASAWEAQLAQAQSTPQPTPELAQEPHAQGHGIDR
jgi:hypothetical protein